MSSRFSTKPSGAERDGRASTAATSSDQLFSTVRLPADELRADWERIIVPEEIKRRLLRYVAVLEWLGKREVCPVALALRQTVLLCGPPGTGKTSLARGLPNVWARRHERAGLLVLVNSHAIPSGERGGTQKNVQVLFQRLSEVASLKQPTFVVVDEVETLATNRAHINPETNPQDTLYGVNAVIEQLDFFVREYPNVVFLLTTNLHAAIDRAVTERTDVQFLIDLPSKEARTAILQDAVSALTGETFKATPSSRHWKRLLKLTEGFSARAMRHLVVEALTFADSNGSLHLSHVIQAASAACDQLAHHKQTGGTYTHAYRK